MRASFVIRRLAVIAMLAVCALAGAYRFIAAETLPAQLSDEAFWSLVTDFSESGGFYLGVGHDQNFTYIVALQPRIAFIVDIRRQNMLEHLMYKALIELSEDRVDFLSKLFSRKRPEDVGAESTAEDLFRAFREV